MDNRNRGSRDRRWGTKSQHSVKKMTYVRTFNISSSLMYACMHDESWGKHWSNRLCRTLSCPGGELVRRGGGEGGEGEGLEESVKGWRRGKRGGGEGEGKGEGIDEWVKGWRSGRRGDDVGERVEEWDKG